MPHTIYSSPLVNDQRESDEKSIVVRFNLPIYHSLNVEKNDHKSVLDAVCKDFHDPAPGNKWTPEWEHVRHMLQKTAPISIGPGLMDCEEGYDEVWEITHTMNPLSQ